MIQTKNWYLNTSTTISRSEPVFTDLGYSLDIPANDVYTAGWQFTKPNTWGKENLLVTRPDPEYFAPNGIIRSNVLPSINPEDPVYKFQRSEHSYTLF